MFTYSEYMTNLYVFFKNFPIWFGENFFNPQSLVIINQTNENINVQ